ncbi:FecR family protein [Sphingobacterium yanglingense]|uniref:FecR family protein n=1 Tax=Sphingobacterium yanglingense TaxID=1437280 RepID=A0A4R6W6G3_9SPHI|nr:FecR family protein [Sphingobacterium yanglingense]TDQ72248.1 FecR family protein [Sphingobacterium yanglingense]
MGKNNHIRSLYHRYINGKTSVKETDDLFKYFDVSSEEDLKQLIDTSFDTVEEDISPVTVSEEQVLHRIDESIHNHIQLHQDGHSPAIRRRFPILRWSAAAAVFIVAGWAIAHWGLTTTPTYPSDTNTVVNDPSPGRTQATLTLADGQLIELKENEEGITIVDNQVKYADGSPIADSPLATKLNTINTPRGGQYRITLPDGTKVWLNAASTLRYPGRFLTNERVVELDGEAYFEVSKAIGKPFRVVSRQQVVQVLGTYFNINSYPDEPSIKTTLLEGAVKVTSADKLRSVTLSPGKQAVLTEEELHTRDADTDVVMAWKNDDFIFRGQNLQTTMRQLARWYDVEIAYASTAPVHLKIGGSISRKNSLSSVLKAMESTNSIAFEFDGKTILVK